MREQLAAAVPADREQANVRGFLANAALPGLAHPLVDRARARGQQAIDVLAGIEAGGECGVVSRERGARRGSPARVIRRPGLDGAHRSLSSPGRRVRISTPSAVTATVCSHCAESLRSLVTTVQPS